MKLGKEKFKKTELNKNISETSSIGPTFPPQESSFGRVKGFETRFIARDDIQISQIDQMMEELVSTKIDDKTTRISFRFLCSKKLLKRSNKFLKKWGEAVFSLSGSDDFNDLYVVYIAYNNEKNRKSNLSDKRKCESNIKTSLRRKPKTFSEIIARVQNNGYKLAVVDINTRTSNFDFREQMINLYSRFGWDKDEVIEILENETTILVVATIKGKVVSAGLAERASVHINDKSVNKELRIAELTEAATVAKHQGKGLYTAVAAYLLRSLNSLEKEEQVHVAFGECNGLAAGVLKAARDLNRTFAYEDSKKLRLPINGMLNQHVPIDGPKRKTTYNDLFPSYITKQSVRKFVNNEND